MRFLLLDETTDLPIWLIVTSHAVASIYQTIYCDLLFPAEAVTRHCKCHVTRGKKEQTNECWYSNSSSLLAFTVPVNIDFVMHRNGKWTIVGNNRPFFKFLSCKIPTRVWSSLNRKQPLNLNKMYTLRARQVHVVVIETNLLVAAKLDGGSRNDFLLYCGLWGSIYSIPYNL